MSVPHSEGCPFCEISTAYDPTDDIPLEAKDVAHCILSTPHVLAFLDHQPIERGHVLVTTRGHYEKLSNVPLVESSALGAWLPIISRAVVKVIESDHPQDWNVVQNNGTSRSLGFLCILCMGFACGWWTEPVALVN